ncbi:hypothetical protein Zmor_025224 [Zophobas morio]|uniref:PH domain-containing protein n=1 Tax=Zophobas morio TaxID=2755281 RepID=A0AA38HRT0_9CUCU|nr:hypothetical protein Zmor_025224 [Zophobas morio]
MSLVCDAYYDMGNSKNDTGHIQEQVMAQYVKLRSQRDIECQKLKEASKILTQLNRRGGSGSWGERLLAERFLLRGALAVNVLRNKIRDDYISISEENSVPIGTIVLSNFKFRVTTPPKRHRTEFYVLLLTSGTEVKCSKVARAINYEIVFDEEFSFLVHDNFRIKLQLHSIVMKDSSLFSSIATLFKIKDCQRRAFSKLQYKNFNTCDFEETKVMKTAFKLCGETEVVSSNLHNRAWKLSLMGGCSLNDTDVGYQFRDVVVWNRRWFVLDGCLLKVYNSPSDEDFGEVLFVINLADCSLGEVKEASRTECTRRRSMVLTINEEDRAVSYYFMADDSQDLTTWLSNFNLILDLLRFKNVHNL